MKRVRTDRMLLGAGVILVLGSAAWSGWQWRTARQVAGARHPLAGGPPQSVEPVPVKDHAVHWSAPKPQARGPTWVFGVFTPPEIFYDAATRRYSVAGGPVATKSSEAAFGLELVRVGRVPFRLQLLGHIGGAGEHLGMFVDTTDARAMLLRAGARLDALGLVIEQIEVQPLADDPVVVGNLRQPVAAAVVRDEISGRTYHLRQGETTYTPQLYAEVRLAGGPGGPREVHPADVLEDGGNRFVIGEIQLTPPGVTVTKETVAPGGKETKVLTPVEPADPPP